jgi:hypothetical protein
MPRVTIALLLGCISKLEKTMKTLLVLFLIFCSSLVQAQISEKDFLKLTWLEGTWKRTNAKPGRSGSEMWKKLSDKEWRGKGVNLRGTDTVFIEKIKLVSKDGSIFYVADVPENKAEVYFKLTELSDTHFVCENPQHDFPKKIAYIRQGNTLKASISGDGKSMEYLFEKME